MEGWIDGWMDISEQSQLSIPAVYLWTGVTEQVLGLERREWFTGI